MQGIFNTIRFILLGFCLLTMIQCQLTRDAWQPAEGPLMTRWAEEVSPKKVHREYPRPQLRRKEWQSLNGLWDYAIRPREKAKPDSFDGKILIPYPVESSLSGVARSVGENNIVWYSRTFNIKMFF